MALPDNQFFEVEWTQHNKGEIRPTDWKGIAVDWAAQMAHGAAYTVVMREDMQVVSVQTDHLKVRGIIDVRSIPKDWGKAPGMPTRHITLRRSE
jgi:hypothetical protein